MVSLVINLGANNHYFSSLGTLKQKLGFASCKRNSGATEGINVLVEKSNSDGKWSYGLSCIEYTEFDKFGIADGAVTKNR